MKQRITLYKEACYNPLKDWMLYNESSDYVAACSNCLEKLFVIPASCEEITLVISNKRFNESYEVYITDQGWYMVEGIKGDSYMLSSLRAEIDMELLQNDLNRIFIGVEL